jgi:hypothetical protein
VTISPQGDVIRTPAPIQLTLTRGGAPARAIFAAGALGCTFHLLFPLIERRFVRRAGH